MKGFRTVLVNGALLAGYFGNEILQAFPTETVQHIAVPVLTVANIILRFMTTTPIGKSE